MGNERLENLLEAWIKMEMSIRGNRVLSEMSFNEMVVCHILLSYERKNAFLTATDLCDRMHLLKSQMNAMLTSMETRGYLVRVRSDNDRRKVYAEITDAGRAEYYREHQQVIQIMQAIMDAIGEENAAHLAMMIQTATEIYQENVEEEE